MYLSSKSKEFSRSHAVQSRVRQQNLFNFMRNLLTEDVSKKDGRQIKTDVRHLNPTKKIPNNFEFRFLST